MELKKTETNFTYNSEEDKTYPNPNDALFSPIEEESPYKISSTYSGAKPKINSSTNVIISIALVIICIGCVIFFYTQQHKYDGKYELESVSVAGMSYTIDEVELYSGQTFSGSLDISGNRVDVYMSANYERESGYGRIKIKGDKVTIKDSSETVTGTYNAGEKTITLDLYGGKLTFKKVD